MSDQHERSSFERKIQELRDRFHSHKQDVQKELADSLAGADRDFGYLRSNNRYEESELKDIAERMRLRATEFESRHPKLGNLFREFAELLRGMGI